MDASKKSLAENLGYGRRCTNMTGATFTKLMEWIAKFVAKIFALLKELKETVSGALEGIAG